MNKVYSKRWEALIKEQENKKKEEAQEFIERWRKDPAHNPILFQAEKQQVSIPDRIKQLQVEIECMQDEIWILKQLQIAEKDELN